MPIEVHQVVQNDLEDQIKREKIRRAMLAGPSVITRGATSLRSSVPLSLGGAGEGTS